MGNKWKFVVEYLLLWNVFIWKYIWNREDTLGGEGREGRVKRGDS